MILFILLVLLVLWFPSSAIVAAAVFIWEAQDHVVGRWDLVLHGISEYQLFPMIQEKVAATIHSDPATASAATTAPQHLFARGKTTATTNRLRQRNLRCNLSLFSNGTFTLEPNHHYYLKENKVQEEIHEGRSDDLSLHDRRRLYLHGRWKVEPNPYCVTDRFNDHLVLQAHPRVQKLLISTTATPAKNILHRRRRLQQQQKKQPPKVLQQVGIQLSCRIWGRYYRQKRQFQRQKSSLGHLTHGSLLWQVVPFNNDDNDPQNDHANRKHLPWWKQRRIAATFSGTLSSPTTKDNGSNHQLLPQDDYDQERFGY